MEKYKIKKYKFKDRVQCVREFDCENPKGAVLALHGMAEHSGRYENFALFLKKLGFIVWVPDHRQHGNSISHDECGIFSKEDTYLAMLKDIDFVYRQMKERYVDLPIHLLGHSMGSILSRAFVQNYQPNLATVVLIGSPGLKVPALGPIKLLANINGALFKGRSKFLGNLAFKGYNARIADAKTPFDWLSTDRKNVEKYIDDELSGYNYSGRFYGQLLTMFTDANSEEKMKKFIDVPVLFLYGSDDPVGQYGEGAEELVNKYNELGKRFELCEYEGMRHELLNEVDKEDVYNEIADFLSGKEEVLESRVEYESETVVSADIGEETLEEE